MMVAISTERAGMLLPSPGCSIWTSAGLWRSSTARLSARQVPGVLASGNHKPQKAAQQSVFRRLGHPVPPLPSQGELEHLLGVHQIRVTLAKRFFSLGKSRDGFRAGQLVEGFGHEGF